MKQILLMIAVVALMGGGVSTPQGINQTSKVKIGTPIWEFETVMAVWSSPAIGSDGTVYVGSYDKKVYALDGVTGAMKWEFVTGGQGPSSPAIGSDGTVYVGSGFGDSKVYALDGKTGAKKWEFELGTIRSPISEKSSVPISLAIGAESTVYVLSTDGKIYALDGKQLGQKPQAHARPESTTNRLGTNPPPTLDSYFEIGCILAFDPQSAFYVINIGANNGIVVGDEYAVFKGSSLAGIIRIKRTESTLAIATGLKVFDQGKIQVGDKVYKLK